MTRRDDSVALQHMLDYAKTAQRMVTGRSREDLDTDEMLRLPLTRAIEVIGEAAARVSSAGRQAHNTIAWTQIVSARNRLNHGYDTVNPDILWGIATLDLPQLVHQLKAILAGYSENEP